MRSSKIQIFPGSFPSRPDKGALNLFNPGNKHPWVKIIMNREPNYPPKKIPSRDAGKRGSGKREK
jgi:hypothetical protein